MDVTHPGSRPLDADQLSLLETFRGKVDSRITNHGLTAADVQMFVDEIKKHPDVSVALLEAAVSYTHLTLPTCGCLWTKSRSTSTSALRSWMPFAARWPP